MLPSGKGPPLPACMASPLGKGIPVLKADGLVGLAGPRIPCGRIGGADLLSNLRFSRREEGVLNSPTADAGLIRRGLMKGA
jgi:hypothetical protein